MFTSRAEYRLQLREDNADLRLTERGRELGLVDDARWQAFCRKRDAIEGERERLGSIWVTPGNDLGQAVVDTLEEPVRKEIRALELLKRPKVTYQALREIDALGPFVEDSTVAEQVEIQVKYAGYLGRQAEDIERRKKATEQALPADFDYSSVRGLSSELTEKLSQVRPQTIGQAQQIPGITPAAISLLLVHLKKYAQKVA